ncbi:MAG: MATE family efflux transporter [Lentimicrobiaceae bacterium]|nr:MATE family efflux transporter [Lentimicrobiaceae bacterium]
MNRQILQLAVPNIISNITVPLLGMVDLAIMGHLGSEVYVGAIALGVIIFNFIYWGFGFLRMGTSGFTAQAYGARDLREMITVLGRSLLVALSAGVLILILQKPIVLLSFYLIHGSEEVEALARQYYSIRIWSAPATLCLYAFTGWFLGMQNARITMVIAILINVLNIGLNFLFVYGLGMKVEGVALGSMLAQYGGLILAVMLFLRYYSRMTRYFEMAALKQWAAFRRFFMVNKDILLRTLFLIVTFSFFTARSAAENDTILAVNTLLLQFLFIFSYFIDGFAYAAESLVGKYTGAKDPVRLKAMIRHLFTWGFFLSIPFTLIYLAWNESILKILTDNQSLITLAKDYMPWVVLVPLLSFAAFIWDGVFIGATVAAPMRNTLFVATFLIFLPTYFISREYIGNHGLWLAMLLFMVTRGVMLSLYARKILVMSRR